MNENNAIEFVLHGKVDGEEITPDYHQPSHDEAALERFAAKGAKAWADVPDPVKWVREMRGE